MAFEFKTADPITVVDVGHWDTGSEEEQAKWHRYRNHGAEDETDPRWQEYTMTGSAVSCILGYGRKTKLRLWQEKKGIVGPEEVSEELQWIFDFGHAAENTTAELFAKATGYYVYQDTHMYQHGAYPWALADMDRRYMRPDGEEGILELKTTNLKKSVEWRNGFPHGYELQLRWYMAIANIQHGAIACFWGNGKNDFAYYEIERDLDIERELFEAAFEFIESLKSNTPPEIDSDPMLALEDLKSLYGKSKDVEKPTLPRTYIATLSRYSELSEEKSRLAAEGKEVEAQMKELIVPIIDVLKDAPGAYCEDETVSFEITYKSNKETKKVSFGDILKKRPDIAQMLIDADLVSTSSARPFKVSMTKK